MSPLTKLFVVLHVVLSLLLTAGMIVFVQRTDNFKVSLKSGADQLQAQTARAQAAEDDARLARDSAEKAVQQVNAQKAESDKQLNEAQSTLKDREASVATLNGSAAVTAANVARLTDALKASEDQKAKLNDLVATLRSDNDGLTKKNSDLNVAVSDLTNKLDVASTERTNFQEQLHEAQAQIENKDKLLHDNGIAANAIGGLNANAGAVAINGVVRDTKTINGIPYATISVGAADSVQKGMQFNVIDRTKGSFLGMLTIDSVEPNQATGKLTGPMVNDVHAGTEVRTQL